ncbi:hypothetical protein [Candidatus Alkanophaga liquidiphilum]|nr:hypothetical protein [Candidatus Alkanophaga liquidiphilum]
MRMQIGNPIGMGVYAAVLGTLYATLGMLEVANVAGFSERMPADVFGGLCLLVIAATFFLGAKELFDGQEVGISFVIVGVALALVFGLLYILIAGADALMYALGELEEFSLLAEIRPEVWLSLVAVAILPHLRRGALGGVTPKSNS